MVWKTIRLGWQKKCVWLWLHTCYMATSRVWMFATLITSMVFGCFSGNLMCWRDLKTKHLINQGKNTRLIDCFTWGLWMISRFNDQFNDENWAWPKLNSKTWLQFWADPKWCDACEAVLVTRVTKSCSVVFCLSCFYGHHSIKVFLILFDVDWHGYVCNIEPWCHHCRPWVF